jgi:hypothetical protein
VHPTTSPRVLRLGALALLAAVCGVTLLAATRYRAKPVRADTAAGDAICLSCHRDKAAFEQTAHRLTSARPTRATIAGSFHEGENVLPTADPRLTYRMDSAKGGFYQTAVLGKAPDTSSRSERFAFVIGSNRKGQTYLYWHADDRLFELPVSYWTGLRQWINSPGYSGRVANFDRPVTPRCLECHATSFDAVANDTVVNRYRAAGVILGVTCEKCHGAGQEHVTRMRSPLRAEWRAMREFAIVNPARLSRARHIDGCALCHGGVGVQRSAAFSYAPGTPLETHLALRVPFPDETVDVHGNQVALLERSRCFRESAMTCATCHDVHRTQRDTTALSARCLGCHQPQSCGLFPQRGNTLVGQCVNCHMPKLASDAIVSDYRGEKERPLVRSHWIRVYPHVAPR